MTSEIAHQTTVQHLARRLLTAEVELASALGNLALRDAQIATLLAELAELRTTGELLSERIAATVPE